MRREFFWCLRHSSLHVLEGGYRRHMDAEHEGRSDAVLMLDKAHAQRLIRGEHPNSVISDANGALIPALRSTLPLCGVDRDR